MLLILYNPSCQNMHFHHIFKEKKIQSLCADIQFFLNVGGVIIRSTLENDCSILEEKLDK